MRSTTNHEYLELHGDVIPGEYSTEGKLLKAGKALHPENQKKIEAMYAMSAAMGGGILLPDAQKKANKATKPKKVPKRNVIERDDDPGPLNPAITQAELDREQAFGVIEATKASVPTAKHAVYLHNALGKIKMQVEAVLDSEMAYCLIFSSEDDVIFTPNPGETLKFVDQRGDTSAVYYANTLFNWTDGSKKLMILFKQDE
ncbi:hypothetical protein [Acinetobacter sp.]|uniref:hypothetical protein n=1 Tax=Acinetobacter sp. TaxID=472 RepID=UPI0037516E54